jgi:hypothetical protein
MTNDTGAWCAVLDAQTTQAELESIIDAEVRLQLVDVLGQIETMGLSARDQAAALVLIAPLLRAQTAAALTSGWQRLQDDVAGPVH